MYQEKVGSGIKVGEIWIFPCKLKYKEVLAVIFVVAIMDSACSYACHTIWPVYTCMIANQCYSIEALIFMR